GRFTGSAHGTIKLKGRMAGNDFVREIPIDFPENMASHDVLASLWARLRVDDLMGQDWTGIQAGKTQEDLKRTITQVGLEYRLMTPFTSFVAVEEVVVTDGGQPRRIDVPIEMPEGVNMDPLVNRIDVTMGYAATPRQVSSLAVNGRTYSGLATISPSARASEAPKPARPKGRSSGEYGAAGGAGQGRPAPPPNASQTVTVTAGVSTINSPAEEISARSPILTTEQKGRQQLVSKFHPSVLAVVDRVKAGNAIQLPDEVKFVTGGKAELQIWLTDKNDEALAALKELGVEVIADPRTSKMLIARVAIEKLEALGQLKWVKYVAPQSKR
ncbi:MAG TPA: hypothetical protein VGD41_15330, partial [Pyrinomonadaceae bacterium]